MILQYTSIVRHKVLQTAVEIVPIGQMMLEVLSISTTYLPKHPPAITGGYAKDQRKVE